MSERGNAGRLRGFGECADFEEATTEHLLSSILSLTAVLQTRTLLLLLTLLGTFSFL